MFRPITVSFQSAPACTYSANKSDVNIYFNDAGDFNASLDILTNTEEKPYSFNALIYSFHGQKSALRDFITFSLMNTGSVMVFKVVTQDGAKSFSISGEGVNIISSRILKSSKNIADQVRSDLSFPDENSLGEHSKKLLESFNLIAKKLFTSIKKEKSSVSIDQNVPADILERICSLLDNENDELLKAHTVKSSLSR